ncbi:MAG: anaerobic ribonucleoside-triphosphate reductase [Planctomycetota bacterium]|jgi:ribonucleoside-triphosphate reductase|nr:anaerobic ribonucleoside-triphosphate reductase [Planctomycetota bacterium]
MSGIDRVVKRDGSVAPFDREKITGAIYAAARAVGGSDRKLADELSAFVTSLLEKRYDRENPPGIEDIQDLVEKALIETGHARTAKAYILYRQRRAECRDRMRVRKDTAGGADSTDIHLLVDPVSRAEYFPWNRARISQALVKEAGLDTEEAQSVAKAVEKRILASGISRISTRLVREIADNELFERGNQKTLERQAAIGLPKYDIEQLILSKSKENSNIAANNPEAINLAIAETVLKQYALQEVFSPDVADAHREGMVHLHDLGYPTRVYCSSHSIEYLKKYGLHLENLDTSSAPARHARTLTGHLNTFLASMQAYYAGALGVAYINIMYAPLVEGMSDLEMRQEAQHLIFSSSQNAFSRGGQTLFLDFNIHTGIPEYLKTVPAIGPGGKYLDRCYGSFTETATRFTRAMLDVWAAGDQYGHIFAFPKCDFHINHETFADARQYAIYRYACEIAAKNGTPYFIFDRDEVTLSACCRLRTVIEDAYMIRHPESMRFCGFQNVTINLPQCAYRAGRGNFARLCSEIERSLEICVKAHLQKKKFAGILMSGPTMPLWQIGKIAADGRPYVDLDQATYIVGVIGLNECLAYFAGKDLHHDAEAMRLGMKIVSHLYFCIKEVGRKLGLKLTIEESPAESAARRLAKIDLKNYPAAAAFMRGDLANDEIYYTNSVHLRPDAAEGIVDRIEKQAKFHSLIESGAIIHAFIGESRPSAGAIASLVRKTFEKTRAAQLTISPEFTICGSCRKVGAGIRSACPHCGAANLPGAVRLDGEAMTGAGGWNREELAKLAGEPPVPAAPAARREPVHA